MHFTFQLIHPVQTLTISKNDFYFLKHLLALHKLKTYISDKYFLFLTTDNTLML